MRYQHARIATRLIGGGPPDAGDIAIVTGQLGRPPRGTWRVATRCSRAFPQVIAVAPALEDGSPFPTTFWLSCPSLTRAVGDIESAGGATRWAGRLAADLALARAAAAADAVYREARSAMSQGADPCEDVALAGQADPLSVKCLHARVAAALAGIGDPAGRGVIAEIDVAGAGRECADDRCRAFAVAAGADDWA